MDIIIKGGALRGLSRVRHSRVIEGHEAFLAAVDGPGAVRSFREANARFRSVYKNDPQQGRTADGTLQHIGRLPAKIYMHHEMSKPGCWEDPSFVRGIFSDCPEFLLNPNCKTADRMKEPRARR